MLTHQRHHRCAENFTWCDLKDVLLVQIVNISGVRIPEKLSPLDIRNLYIQSFSCLFFLQSYLCSLFSTNFGRLGSCFPFFFLVLFCFRLFLSFNKMIKRNETQKKDKNGNKRKEKSSIKSNLNTTAWI